jgi:hypothetical protein
MAKSDVNQYLPALTTCIQKTFEAMCSLSFEKPVITKSKIIEYGETMRVSAMEKFDGPTFIAMNEFTYPKGHRFAGEPAGALLSYVPQEHAAYFLQAAGYGNIEALEEIQDSTAEFNNIVAGNFKGELVRQGYTEVDLKESQGYYCAVNAGVHYDMEETEKIELMYQVGNKKILAFELTLGQLQKKK